jgi:tRNA(Ile)-lysidine synthase
MLVSEVQRFIDVQGLLPREARVIVSVSGGADSMALLSVLHGLVSTYRLTLSVVHINHHLRDKEATRDALFVESYSDRLGLPFHKVDVDVRFLKRRTGMSSQLAARQLRYGALFSLCDSLAATHVALGHTADDQAETILLRLLRGVGPAGLAGIPAKRLPFIRPLLGVHRDSIHSYLGAAGIPWVEDSSNMSRAYLRNRVRLELMPVMGEYRPGIAQRLRQTADMLRADNDVLEEQTRVLAEQAVGREVGRSMLAIRRPPFVAAPLAMQRRLLRHAIDWLPCPEHASGFQDIETLVGFSLSGGRVGRRLTLAGRVMAEWHNDAVLLWRAGTLPATSMSMPLPVPGLLSLKGLSLSVAAKTHILKGEWRNLAGPCRVFASFEAVARPLSIRFPRPGDRFQPLGAAGSQKLQDFFVNNKVPRAVRPYVPLVISRGQILWVVGYRIGDPFKVREDTRRVLELSCSGAPC